MLTLEDVLQHPEVDTLVVVHSKERLLDPVDLAVGDNRDVQKVPIKSRQELEVAQEKKRGQDHQRDPSTGVASTVHDSKHHVADGEDEGVPDEHLGHGPHETYPVLVKVECKGLSGMLALEVDIARWIARGNYHKKK